MAKRRKVIRRKHISRKKRRIRKIFALVAACAALTAFCMIILPEIAGAVLDADYEASLSSLSMDGNPFITVGRMAAESISEDAGDETEEIAVSGDGLSDDTAFEENTSDEGNTSNDTDDSDDSEVASEDAPVIRIVIDAGHGGSGGDDATYLGAIYRGTYEKYLTLTIAEAMGEELSEYGNVEVFYTRTTDTAMTLKERAQYAYSVGADYLISLHLNASEEHNYFGSEVFTSAFGEYYAYGSALGTSFLKQLTNYGFVSKGVKTRLGSSGQDYYGIIRECRELGVTAIIVEHGYMDQDDDWALMDTDEELEALGRLDARAVASFFGLKKGETQSDISEPDITLPDSSPVNPDTTPPTEVYYSLTRLDEEQAEITLYAVEEESMLMYYSLSLDGGESADVFSIWDGGESVTFTAEITVDGEDELTILVYNNYELYTEAVRQ